jgi:hypothetical protein
MTSNKRRRSFPDSRGTENPIDSAEKPRTAPGSRKSLSPKHGSGYTPEIRTGQNGDGSDPQVSIVCCTILSQRLSEKPSTVSSDHGSSGSNSQSYTVHGRSLSSQSAPGEQSYPTGGRFTLPQGRIRKSPQSTARQLPLILPQFSAIALAGRYLSTIRPKRLTA